MTGKKVLILSDGKPGHVNQSVAFARLLGLDYILQPVAFKSRFCKALSYLYDWAGFYTEAPFRGAGALPEAELVISAGSSTYYANKVLARRLGARSVAIMLPRGYRYNFDLIVAQQHDNPPLRHNLLTLPVNLSYPEPRGLVQRVAGRTIVAVVVGGPSAHFDMDATLLERQLQEIFTLFPQAVFWAATSRRTPSAVEALIERLPFQYRVIYSRQEVNPLPDFWVNSDYVFVSEDSTSMISEAVSCGGANVEILPLPLRGRSNKVGRMVQMLADQGYLHVFDGKPGSQKKKLSLDKQLKTAVQRLF